MKVRFKKHESSSRSASLDRTPIRKILCNRIEFGLADGETPLGEQLCYMLMSSYGVFMDGDYYLNRGVKFDKSGFFRRIATSKELDTSLSDARDFSLLAEGLSLNSSLSIDDNIILDGRDMKAYFPKHFIQIVDEEIPDVGNANEAVYDISLVLYDIRGNVFDAFTGALSVTSKNSMPTNIPCIIGSQISKTKPDYLVTCELKSLDKKYAPPASILNRLDIYDDDYNSDKERDTSWGSSTGVRIKSIIDSDDFKDYNSEDQALTDEPKKRRGRAPRKDKKYIDDIDWND